MKNDHFLYAPYPTSSFFFIKEYHPLDSMVITVCKKCENGAANPLKHLGPGSCAIGPIKGKKIAQIFLSNGSELFYTILNVNPKLQPSK